MTTKHLTLLCSAITAALVLASAASARHGDAPGAPQLRGTWTTTIWLTNAPPGVDPTFQALDTFVPGGGILVSSSQSHPTTRSLAHGTCARIAGARYTCTFVWFRFDAAGAYAGMQRVRRTMTVRGDTFQADDTIEVLAPDGTVVASLQGTETGRRLGS